MSGHVSQHVTRHWTITGRHLVQPPPPDWRQQLATRLGGRPRRVGPWVELALYGALACLDDSGESRLPDAALLNLSTMHGPDLALRAALVDCREGLPLPIGFMASQPGQVLPTLARYLDWHGDGRCLAHRDPLTVLRYACLEAGIETGINAGAPGLLAGWVDEDDAGTSLWLRLVPATAGNTGHPPGRQPATRLADLADPAITGIVLLHDQVLVTGPFATEHVDG